MTIATTTNRVDASGNGSATSFSFSPVVIFEASDLQVTLRDSAGQETLLTQGAGSANYSVSVTAYPGTGSITYPASGGTPLPAGSTIVIKRIVPLLQSVSLSNQGAYFPKIQEGEYDYLTAIDQQQQEQLSRAMTGAPTDGAGPLALPTSVARANGMLGFDSFGNPVVAQPATALVTSAMQIVTGASTLRYGAQLLGTQSGFCPEQFASPSSLASDASVGINAAIAAAAAIGGGIVFLSASNYSITHTITVSSSNVRLIGCGRGGNHDVNPVVSAATTITWAGANGGTMISVSPLSGAGNSRVVGWGVEDIALVSGVYPYSSAAALGCFLASCAFGKLKVTTIEFTSVAVACTGVASLAENSLFQWNDLDIVARQVNTSGTVLQMGGYVNVNNSCFNRIVLSAEYNNGIGIDLQDADNNTFLDVYLQKVGGGTGNPLYLRGGTAANPGYARNNIFIHYSQSVTSAQIFSEVTGTFGSRVVVQPAVQNQILFFDQANIGFSLFEGTGSTFWVGKNTLPLGMADLHIGSTDGYKADIAGLYEVWGQVTVAGNTTTAITFPNSFVFPNGIFIGAAISGGDAALTSVTSPTSSGFSLFVNTYPNPTGTRVWYWRAWGR